MTSLVVFSLHKSRVELSLLSDIPEEPPQGVGVGKRALYPLPERGGDERGAEPAERDPGDDAGDESGAADHAGGGSVLGGYGAGK